MIKPQKKPYWEMNTEELAEATKEFDEEFVASKGRPLTRAQRALLARAKRRGRPTVGKGTIRVSVSFERERLAKLDRNAKAAGVSRSRFIAESVDMRIAKGNGSARRKAG